MEQPKLYKCPYDSAISCDMKDGCRECEDFTPGELSIGQELKQLIQLQIENCKKFAGSTNNDYYEGAIDAYNFIKEKITDLENARSEGN